MSHVPETPADSRSVATAPTPTRVKFHARCRPILAAWTCLCVLFGVGANSARAANDVDLDGLSDAFESYLNIISSNPAWDVSPLNGDSDGDSQPDGFEFCLSNRAGAVSPGVVHPVVPKMTLVSHQQGSDIAVSLMVIPGALSVLDDFHLYVAVKDPAGKIVLVDLTAKLATTISSVDFVWWGPHQMAVLEFKIPVEFVRLYGAVAIAATGRLDGMPLGDSLSLSSGGNKIFRWTYVKAKAGGNGSSATGYAEPQEAAAGETWNEDEVCGSVDSQVPTETPGVLQSVVVSIGCTAGAFACDGGICSMGGAASAPKLILDVDLLLGS